MIIWAYVICVVYTVIWLEYKTLNEQTREATCKNYLHFVSVFNDMLYLFVHISRAITASFDYHRVWWHGIRTFFFQVEMIFGQRDTCWSVNWVFIETVPNYSLKNASPSMCVARTSAHLFTWMRNAADKIFCDHSDKFIRIEKNPEGTKYKTWHAQCTHIWMTSSNNKKIHSGAYCCCNFVSFTRFFLSNNCHNRLMYKVVIRLIERNLYYSVCLSYALSRLFVDTVPEKERMNESKLNMLKLVKMSEFLFWLYFQFVYSFRLVICVYVS